MANNPTYDTPAPQRATPLQRPAQRKLGPLLTYVVWLGFVVLAFGGFIAVVWSVSQ